MHAKQSACIVGQHGRREQSATGMALIQALLLFLWIGSGFRLPNLNHVVVQRQCTRTCFCCASGMMFLMAGLGICQIGAREH